MALVIKRTDTCVSSPADGARDVMSVDSQFRINNDNTSYAPLQTSSVYSLSNGGNYQPTTSTPKKFPEADFETIKPLNFASDNQCESEQEDSRQEARQDPPSTPPPLRDIECGETQPTEDGADLNSSNNDQGKQPSPLSYSECYNSDSSCATTPLKWEPRSPLTPQTPLSSGGTPYSNVYPFALHSPDRDRERELAFIPRKDQNGVDLYFCHLCSFTGTTREIFSAHMSTHFEHACPHCDYTSRTEGRLKRHIKDFHSSSPPENFSGNKSPKAMPGRPKVYRCKQCEFVATEKLDFWAHARTHIKEDKLLQCPKCPFVTEYKHHLEYHLRNHFGSKPFKCNKCNYACVNKSMLNSHMKSHTNVYQYRCADCTYATKYCHSLKLHLRKYNHKPATVLNSDGSLPQGLDAEAAGLSLMMKRGPPRGPRGPRKDKLEAYLGQLMSMPHMGPRPGMNGLMSPYWPILGQFPNGFHHPPPLIPIPPHGNGMMPVLPQQRFAGPGMYRNQQLLTLKCTFCCFTTESKDDLANHMLKVHASENQDLFNAFGISSEALLDEQKERERRRSGENGTDDHLEDYSKKPRSEIDRPPSHPIHSLNMTESLHIRTDNDEVTKSSPRSWPPASTDTLEKETMNGCKSMPDLYFNSSKASTTSPDSGSKEDDSSDILRQMTLKFGGSSSKPREQKESPLDLTKPKALAAANYFAAVKRSYEQMEFNSHREHIMESVHRSQLDGSNVDDTASPAPRKRSRKGKAYKLDTIAMKLQGMSSDADPSAHEDTHSIGSHDDMEENSDHYSEKDADFHDITMRNRGDLNMSEERDDLSEEKAQPLPTSQSIPHGQIKEEQVSVGKDLEQLHRNLKLLNENETEKKEGMSAEDRCPSPVSDIRRCSMGSSMGLPDLPHFGKGGHSQTNIKDELALKAAYALKNSGTHSAVRKGAEIAWKILNPGQSSGAMAPQQNSVPSQNQDRREMHTNMPPTMYPSVCSTLPPSQKLTTKVNGVNGSLFSGSNAKKGGRNCDKYECSYCEIAFGDCVMYTMHMGYHGYKDPYKCNMCGHQSRDKVDFFLHIAREAHA